MSNIEIKIIKAVKHICENHVSLKRNYVSDRRIEKEGICFCVYNYEIHYNELLGIIFKKLNSKNFSSDYVKNFIDRLIANNLKKMFLNLPLGLEHFEDTFQDVVVYIPLSGLELEVNELKVGKIVFKKIGNELIKEITEQWINLLKNNPTFNPKNFDEAIQYEKNKIIGFKDKTCAIYTDFAEEKIAIQKGYEECEKSLDVLRFATYFFHSPKDRVSIGFEGEINRYYQRVLAHKSNFYGFRSSRELRGPLTDFQISESKVEHMQKIGIFELSNILSKQHRTEFEEMILLGTHWFSNSLIQTELENQFISLTIALEIFLTPSSEIPISTSIAESVAIILLKGLENRKKWKDDVKKLYNKRSRVVHGSKDKNLISNKDVNQLKDILAHLILWLAKKTHIYSNKGELMEYVENVKFR